MAQFDLIMPKMGESVAEATIIKWLKKPGDTIELDEPVLEIATDKVDSEIPSPVAGVLGQILFQEGETIQVNAVIAYINTSAEAASAPVSNVPASSAPVSVVEKTIEVLEESSEDYRSASGRFYSPLVRNIAKEEHISMEELETLIGTGKDGRVTKNDILAYLPQRKNGTAASPATHAKSTPSAPASKPVAPAVSVSGGDEIIEMDRMRKLIADHMVMSKAVSPHVTSFIEVDMTNIV
ncbi:MAG TPA: E3 binding domain-containing protein, partial [Flavobacteriales bacterium]|nr:E3 binding domain-containing protein [Flavobacteriales bacterium]